MMTGRTNPTGLAAHPNDFDCKRIERALLARQRYRYVSPRVLAVAGGYRIESPCCSRNVDADGNVIDIAFIEYEAATKSWRLYCKDHAEGDWALENSYARLNEALARLNADPDRKFWQ